MGSCSLFLCCFIFLSPPLSHEAVSLPLSYKVCK
jgi:hypothetical protein